VEEKRSRRHQISIQKPEPVFVNIYGAGLLKSFTITGSAVEKGVGGRSNVSLPRHHRTVFPS
jgi:hypothetical protein